MGEDSPSHGMERYQGDVVPIRAGVAMKGQGKNQWGLTARQESFAHAVAAGSTLTAAYRACFECPNAADKTVWTKASELASRDVVQRRVDELVEQRRVESSLDSARMLQFIRERLLTEAQDTKSKPADRLKALELMGKLSDVGAFRERIVEEQADTKSALELEREIKKKLEKILAA